MDKISEYKKRRDMILSFIMESYVEDGRPVSSGALQQKYDLPYSSATIRNVMVELDEMGYITNVHTSSGRVPTQEGFRYYITFLMPRRHEYQEVLENDIVFYRARFETARKLDEVLDTSSKMISDITHQAGVSFSEDDKERVFVRGAHYMFDHPEIGDMAALKQLFTALEEKAHDFWDLFDSRVQQDTYVFVGDELSVVKSGNCSMVITPVTVNGVTRAMFGVLGPMRMNYSEVILKLGVVRQAMEDICKQKGI
jgi:transcriptional regulator of heat shock response